MGLFSRFKKKGVFNLSETDFISKTEDYVVVSVKLRSDFFQKFPQAKKKENYTGKKSLITHSAKVNLFGNSVVIAYNPGEIELDGTVFFDTLNHKLNWIANNEEAIKNGIAKKLVPLKNEPWLNENELEISTSEFKNRLKLTEIRFYRDGSAELSFDDDDLFSNHEIIAVLNLKNELIEINIRG